MSGTAWTTNDFTHKNYKTITIKRGDTLSKICRRHFGSFSKDYLKQILDINPAIVDKNYIVAGKKMFLPILKKKQARKYASVPSKPIAQKKTLPEIDYEPPDTISNLEIKRYNEYPPPMPGIFISLEWLNDNRAVINGRVNTNAVYQFFVYVPGDIEYKVI